MGPATFLKILEDATIELEDMLKPLELEKRRSLFTADTTGTEADDRPLLQLLRKLTDRLGKFPEMADRERRGSREGAKLHLVGIARVEQRKLPSLVDPLLQFLGGNPRGGMAGRIDPLYPKGDDLLLELHEHPVEGLLLALADLRLQMLQPRDRTESAEYPFHGGHLSCYEEIDPLGTQQDAPLESPLATLGAELLAQLFEMLQLCKLIGGDVEDGHG